ncbi:MAG: TlpA family protein disulfide reductase [Oligoflexia bacterium]|nr:TlpA family protein disulfide reductase [Oligoflexia bacterium]
MIKKLLLTLTFGFIAAFSLSSQAGLKVGDSVPCITLTQVMPDGSETHGCISDAQNPAVEKAVVLDFMSIECSYCLRDLPTISKLATDLKGIATVRQVTLDENMDEFKAWHKQMVASGVIHYPFAMDPRNKSVNAYKLEATPTVYVIKSGIIAYAHVGMLRSKDVEDIKKAVNQ